MKRAFFLAGILAAAATVATLAAQATPAPTRAAQQQARTSPSTSPSTDLATALAARTKLESRQISRGATDVQLNAAGLAQPTPPATWLPLGPQGITSAAGAQSGRINAITADPNNPGRFYMAPAGGGVWRSDNYGGFWQPTQNAMSSMSSGALVFDGRINTLYYGTGDAFSNIAYGAGVFKSTDAGITWRQMGTNFSGGLTYRIALHPTATQTLLVARNSGIWITNDGGNTWTKTLSTASGCSNAGTPCITDVAIDANTPNLAFGAVYNSFGAASNGVYRSLDGGNTWTLLTALPTGNSIGRISIAKTAASSAAVCVLIANSNGTLNGVYRSDDFGGTWRALSVPSALFYNGSYYNGAYDQLLVMDPSSANSIFVGGWDLFRSTDGGQTWQTLSTNAQGQPVMHQGIFSLAFVPGQSGTFFVGTEGGLYYTIDGAGSWFNLNASLPIALINAVAIYPGGSQILQGGESVGVSAISGQFAGWSQLLSGYVGSLFVDPSTPSTFYAGQIQTSLDRSSDTGSSWSSVNPPTTTPSGEYYAPFVADPNNPGNVLFGSSQIWRSTNQGSSWTPVSPQLATNGDYFTALAIATGSPRTIGVTGYGNVFYSADGATGWAAGTGLPSGLYLTGVAFDAQNPLKAYLTAWGFGNGHVYRTLDGGASWQNIGTNLQLPDAPANGIVVDPRGPVYVATDVGVFRNNDGASTWTSFNDGLPSTFVTSLALDAASNELVAGTYGRGAYQVALQAPSAAGPSITAAGVVDAASGFQVLAPGTTAIIYGTNLATGTATGSPVAGNLLLTTVTVNGVQAPLFYASPAQINFQMPFEVTNSEAYVVVTTPNGAAAQFVAMAPAAPGIFSVNHASGTPVTAANPASAGEVLVIGADGLGNTNPGATTGTVPASATVPMASSVTATIGGATAVVQYAGITGIGVNQVNVAVPSGATGTVAVVIQSAGRLSNSVTIVVH